MDEEQITINSILECLDFGLRIDEKDIQDLLDIVKKKNEIIKKQSYTNKKMRKTLKTVRKERNKQQKEIKELKQDNAKQWEERCRLTFKLQEAEERLSQIELQILEED